jgi:hypothetical protein
MATVDAAKLRWKLPQLNLAEIEQLVNRFKHPPFLHVDPSSQCSLDSTNHMDQRELIKVCQSLSGTYSYDDVRDAIKRANINTSGKVDAEEFLEVVIMVHT